VYQRRLATAAVPLLIGSLALSACGSSSSSSKSSGSPSSPSAGSSSGSSAAPAPKAKDQLTIGTLLPETGDLAFLGPPEIAGTSLAINDVNAAGGVLGKPVKLVKGDSGDTSTNIASQTVDRELGQGVGAIIGAASSGVTLTVIDKVVQSGTILFSPANTSQKLTDYPKKGLYFRTAPPDNLQGQLDGDVITGDGHQKIAIVARQDPYGTGLANSAQKSIEAAGGQVVKKVVYDPNAQSYDNEVDQLVQAKPDAILYITFDEGAKILTRAIEKGIGPDKVPAYFVDGNVGNSLGDKIKKPGVLGGSKGTQPGTKKGPDFIAKLKAIDPKLKDFNYSDSSYDAVIITALAAEVAKTDDPAAVSKQINDVTRGGEVCKTFAECLPLAKAGKDLHYEGILGDISFTDKGEPAKGSYEILQYGKGTNKINDALTKYQVVSAQ